MNSDDRRFIRYIDESPLHRTEEEAPRADESFRHRSLADTLNETKAEVKEFVQTRIAMLQSEMKDKVSTFKSSLPMLVAGALFALTAFWVLVAALIALVWVIFAGSAYAIFLACLIVGVILAIAGGAALLFGYQNIKGGGLMPKRTLNVLKEDKIWFQNEARSRARS